ncbi:MAG: MBL fold metallo-hydrolase [Syntrophobacter sp.]
MNFGSRLHHPLFLTAVLGLFLIGFSGNASAEAPMAKFQAPGFYRMMLGQFEITALSDGFIDMDINVMRNAPETEIRALLDRMSLVAPKIQISVNAYLVNTGSKLILIDAGSGSAMGPTLGRLPQNLAAAGYTPDQVDYVLITHMHGDHIPGLLDSAGKPVFPKATVLVSKPENEYWLSSAESRKATPDRQKFFELARTISAVYSTLGKWSTFESGQLLPGIQATVMPGHTPGHTVFEISSDNQSFLVLGDTVHSMAVQFSRPEVSFVFDTDPKQAISVRNVLFKKLAESKALAAGMHLPFPGIGRVLANGAGGYIWAPVEFSPIKN